MKLPLVLPLELPLPNHIMLFNPKRSEIEAAAERNPQWFVFSFFTGNSMCVEDMKPLQDHPEADHIVNPVFLGNLKPDTAFLFAQYIVAHTFDYDTGSFTAPIKRNRGRGTFA